MYRAKLIRAETKAVGDGRIHAILSTEADDRDGDIVRQSGWDLSHFERHPVMVASHDYHDLRSQIGEWHDMKVKGSGKGAHLEGVAEYYVGRGNEQADWGYDLAQRGKAAYSVGFVPLEEPIEREGGGYEFTRQELLEVSHVLVPSNRGALQLMHKMADLHPVLAELVEAELGENKGDSEIDKGKLLNQVMEQVRLILPDEVAMLLKRLLAAQGETSSLSKSITDEDKRVLVREIRELNMTDLVATHRRLHQMAARGALLTNFTKADMNWFHAAVEAELVRRAKEDNRTPPEPSPLEWAKSQEEEEEDEKHFPGRVGVIGSRKDGVGIDAVKLTMLRQLLRIGG